MLLTFCKPDQHLISKGIIQKNSVLGHAHFLRYYNSYMNIFSKGIIHKNSAMDRAHFLTPI